MPLSRCNRLRTKPEATILPAGIGFALCSSADSTEGQEGARQPPCGDIESVGGRVGDGCMVSPQTHASPTSPKCAAARGKEVHVAKAVTVLPLW